MKTTSSNVLVGSTTPLWKFIRSAFSVHARFSFTINLQQTQLLLTNRSNNNAWWSKIWWIFFQKVHQPFQSFELFWLRKTTKDRGLCLFSHLEALSKIQSLTFCAGGKQAATIPLSALILFPNIFLSMYFEELFLSPTVLCEEAKCVLSSAFMVVEFSA